MTILQQKIDWLRKLGASTEGSGIMAFTPGDRASLRELADDLERLSHALIFVKELSRECMDNGDVRVGQASEIAMRHIWRRADKALS